MKLYNDPKTAFSIDSGGTWYLVPRGNKVGFFTRRAFHYPLGIGNWHGMFNYITPDERDLLVRTLDTYGDKVYAKLLAEMMFKYWDSPRA